MLEQTAEVRGEDGNTVRLRVEIDKSRLPDLHDQVTVAARIQCGDAPLGYVEPRHDLDPANHHRRDIRGKAKAFL